MNKKIRIEFEEFDGYPQNGTMKLWIDSEEITDPLVKGTMIKLYAQRLPWQINPCNTNGGNLKDARKNY